MTGTVGSFDGFRTNRRRTTESVARSRVRSQPWRHRETCVGPLEKRIKGGLILIGALNLGESVEPMVNAVGTVEVTAEKGASVALMPVSARRPLFDASDDMATQVNAQLYSDIRDALLNALLE